jgi:hypothetical protein
MTEQDVFEQLLEECRVDHVGLWELVDAAQVDLGASDANETRVATLALARRLLHEPGIQVGHPAPGGRDFVPWNLPPEEALKRIEREWSALGHEPNIGEVAWFTSPD